MAAPIDLSSETSLEKQAFRAIMALQEAEKAVTGDVQPNNVNLTIDTDDNEASATVNFGLTFTNSSGKLEVVATDYIA